MVIITSTYKNIILVCFILISLNSYGICIFKPISDSSLVNSNRFIDSIKLETKYGFINVENECDSNSSMTYMTAELNYSSLKKTLEESEKLNIDSDKGSLIFVLNYKGNLLECKLGKPAKLNEFNNLIQQFAFEINLKYKNETIISCNDEINKDNIYFELPFNFNVPE